MLFEERIALLTPRRHALASKRRIVPEDLAAYPILLSDRGCAYRRTIETALRGHGVTLPRILEVSSARAMMELVMAGLGVGFFPVKGAAVPNGALRQVSGLSLSLPIGIVSRADRALTPVQQTLCDRLRAQLKR